MAGPGGRDADRDDFDWLYGGAPRPQGGRDDDATRMIPTMGPGSGEPASDDATRAVPRTPARDPGRDEDLDRPPPSIAPTPGGRGNGGGAGRGSGGGGVGGGGTGRGGTGPGRSGRSRGSRIRRRVGLLTLIPLALLVFWVSVPIYSWTTVEKVDAEPRVERPEEQPGTTYLVVGSDAREGLSGQRTDTIMLLHTGSGPNLLMSVPRDSLVEVPDYGTEKINAAFAFGGARLLTRTLEQETGIRIDHYVEIGFTGFVDLVDAVGGVEICPEEAIQDRDAALDIPAGCQQADGDTALGYARSRKSQQLGDIDRARHQREVVSAIGGEVVSWRTVVNPVRYWRVNQAGAGSVRVSEGTGPVDAARFALAMTSVDGEEGLTCGVPIADLAVNWDRERADRLFRLIAEDRTGDVGRTLCTPTGIAR